MPRLAMNKRPQKMNFVAPKEEVKTQTASALSRISIKLHAWHLNRKYLDPISETIWGNLESAKIRAQEIWLANYPGAAKQIYIYDDGCFFRKPLLKADNFDKFKKKTT